VSVEQWKQQLEKWSNLPPKYIACFTASQKDRIQTDALVLITTYNMVRRDTTRGVGEQMRGLAR